MGGSQFHCIFSSYKILNIHEESHLNFHSWYLSFSVNASQAGAGNLEIIVSVNGCNVPNYVQSEGNAKFRVNFKPREAAPHSLSVRFNGEPVPGTLVVIPFLVRQTTKFRSIDFNCKKWLFNKLDIGLADSEYFDLFMKFPRCYQLLLWFSKVDNSRFWFHSITYPSVTGSPFTCKIFKPDHIIANESGLKTCHVNRQASIAIDSPSDSAIFKVAVIAPNGHQLPIDSSTKADKKIVTKFTPIEVGKGFS